MAKQQLVSGIDAEVRKVAATAIKQAAELDRVYHAELEPRKRQENLNSSVLFKLTRMVKYLLLCRVSDEAKLRWTVTGVYLLGAPKVKALSVPFASFASPHFSSVASTSRWTNSSLPVLG